MVSHVIAKNTNPHAQLILFNILLHYGRLHPSFFRSVPKWAPLIPILMDHLLVDIEGASFARPPVAHLPGHKSASVVVKFSPVLYELRSGVKEQEPKSVSLTKGGEEQVVDLELDAGSTAGADVEIKDASAEDTPSASVFKLPYRMMFAVATQDTVVLYDTQQAGPIAMFANLHYASFTDVAW